MGTSEMSSFQRVQSVMALKEPDRVPVIVRSRSFSIRYSGLKISDCWGNVDRYIDCQLRCLKEFGYDTVEDYPGSALPIFDAMGGEIRVMENSLPSVEPLMTDPSDLERLSVPDLNQGKVMADVHHIIRVLKKESGVPVLATVEAPFGTACSLRGTEQFYMDMIERPEFAQELLGFALKLAIAYVDALVESQPDIIYVPTPQASRSCISKIHYLKFVTEDTRQFFEFVHKKGFKIISHACGDWSDRVDLVAKEKPDVISFDKVDLREMKEQFGSQLCIMGNVRTVETLLQGTPEQVKKEALSCIQQAGIGGGYVLSAACVTPPATPGANLKALIETAKEYGTYPLKF